MEKPTKTKSKSFFKYFPKSASFGIPNQPYSPTGRERRAERFSGPAISIVPEEARRKTTKEAYETQEPTSPKVSCIGQIKHKKKCYKGGVAAGKFRREDPGSPISNRKRPPLAPKDRKPSRIRAIFHRKARTDDQRSEDEDDDNEERPTEAAAAPRLGQMRRFTSGRDALAGFDWREGHRRDKVYADEDDEDEEEDFRVPHSAPIMMGGGGVAAEPKKEVNLWKRRTITPPIALQLG